MNDVTRMLEAIKDGNGHAADELLPVVYQELRRLANYRLRQESAGHTLQATALVHEAYLRLVGTHEPDWQGHTHFFNAAADAMRRILIDSARRKQRLKRGGGQQRVELDAEAVSLEMPSDDLVALDQALELLAEQDPTKAELVKLRYFAGLTLVQAAQVLGISNSTAKRHWTYAKAWLYGRVRAES